MARSEKSRKPKPSRQVDRRKTTSTRITPEVRSLLERAASQSGRSLAQEIELRLERSFAEEDALHREFGSADNYRIAKLLFAVVPIIEAETGRSWRDHGPTFTQVAGAWATFLKVLRGQASKTPGGLFDVGDEVMGREKAIALMHERIEDLVRQPSKAEMKAEMLVKALMSGSSQSPPAGKRKSARRR